MVENPNLYVVENIWPVEVVGLDMRKIPKDTWDGSRTDGLKSVLGDLS